MKKILFLTLMSVFCSSIVLAQPKLTIIGGDTYDWKEVKVSQSPLKAEVQLKNEGNELLKIEEVRPGCGCTTAPLDKNELQPGEVATLNITFNVGSYTGSVSKSILIRSNDPQKPRRYFEIRANVIREIVFKPAPYMPFRDLKVGEESTSTLYIKNNSKINIKFSNLTVEPKDTHLRLNIDSTTEIVLKPGEEFELTGRLTPRSAGYQNIKVMLQSTHPDFPTIAIPAYGTAAASPYFQNEPTK